MATTVMEKQDRQIAQHYGSAKGERSAELTKSIGDFIPATGTIVVLQWDPEKVTKGGIHLPDAYATEQMCGEVVSVPEDADCEYKIGDTVLFRNGGCAIVLNNVKYMVLQFRGAIDDEILGRFPRE